MIILIYLLIFKTNVNNNDINNDNTILYTLYVYIFFI